MGRLLHLIGLHLKEMLNLTFYEFITLDSLTTALFVMFRLLQILHSHMHVHYTATYKYTFFTR